MASLNRVFLIGNLGRDPEIKTTDGGLQICSFSIATKEMSKTEVKTEWHKIVAFGKLAELCGKYLAKGKPVFVEGRIQTRSWDGKDGTKKYGTEIVAHAVQFLGSGSGVSAPGEIEQPPQQDAGDSIIDDIPF